MTRNLYLVASVDTQKTRDYARRVFDQGDEVVIHLHHHGSPCEGQQHEKVSNER